MRLSRELISSAPQSINPINDRQVTLRGYRIAVVENLGVTNDAFDCMDLSDNDIIRLDGFPVFNRLSSVIVANNRIARIGKDIAVCLPSLKSLVATGNHLEALEDLLPLVPCKKLERLQLADNPVTSVPEYRRFLIYKIPSLRYIDFLRIRDQDRKDAKAFFESEEGKALLEQIQRPKAVPVNPSPVTKEEEH